MCSGGVYLFKKCGQEVVFTHFAFVWVKTAILSAMIRIGTLVPLQRAHWALFLKDHEKYGFVQMK